jgi:hypothetical protein
VIDFNLKVLGFGAMVTSTELKAEHECAIAVPGDSQGRTATVGELGGARHRSAADFCYSERSALAFVASQDGRLTIICWLSNEGRLAAIRRAERYLA